MKYYHSFYLALLALAFLTACSDKEEPSLSEEVIHTENPRVYLYVEDIYGESLIDGERPVAVTSYETEGKISYAIEECPLPWSLKKETGKMIAFAPAEPFHADYDPAHVYTLVTQTNVTIGDARIRLKRNFDYNLRRYQAKTGGRGVEATFFPTATFLSNYQDVPVQGDTLHLIISDGEPFLRVEGEEVVVEMRLPVPEGLDHMPALTEDSLNSWHADDLLRARLVHDGLLFARPYGHATLSGPLTDEEGMPYVALRVGLRLPHFYASYYYSSETYLFRYFIESPLLFGDEGEHCVIAQLFNMPDYYGYKGGLVIESLHRDLQLVESPQFEPTLPRTLIIDWRE